METKWIIYLTSFIILLSIISKGLASLFSFFGKRWQVKLKRVGLFSLRKLSVGDDLQFINISSSKLSSSSSSSSSSHLNQPKFPFRFSASKVSFSFNMPIRKPLITIKFKNVKILWLSIPIQHSHLQDSPTKRKNKKQKKQKKQKNKNTKNTKKHKKHKNTKTKTQKQKNTK